ncbi:hypothetical protein JRO89_XS15G0055500 [Xanthoceras sorbifolium]|uniref:Methyltransferase domain-containing protein n=1 Tax=Xanthoceras sorbifolium TaxID=99658 RepID=A0ABQ8H129_9ROSI|nr:hypothetical protein JRO89_XS15G0055500 [Xanthoceras sorbifolium]
MENISNSADSVAEATSDAAIIEAGSGGNNFDLPHFPYLSITGHKINGKNYLQWSQSVLMYIRGREKTNYLFVDLATLEETNPGYKRWMTENIMIMSWLVNSMTTEIGENFILYYTAKEIWDATKEIYSNKDNSSELVAIEGVLHDLRGQILGMKPIPSLCEAFSEVRREESHKKLMMGPRTDTPAASSTEASALVGYLAQVLSFQYKHSVVAIDACSHHGKVTDSRAERIRKHYAAQMRKFGLVNESLNVPKTITCHVLSMDMLKALTSLSLDKDDVEQPKLIAQNNGELDRRKLLSPCNAESETSLVLAGLHACGDLSSAARWRSLERDAGVHNFELHAFRAAFQMLVQYQDLKKATG